MIPNINTDTKVHFGWVAANDLDSDIISSIQGGVILEWDDCKDEQQEQLARDAGWISDRDALEWSDLPNITPCEGEEPGDYWMDYGEWCDEYYLDWVNDVESPDEERHAATIEGVQVETAWLGGALLVCVTESPFVHGLRLCSPCVPNGHDIHFQDMATPSADRDPDTCYGYTVPPTWWRAATYTMHLNAERGDAWLYVENEAGDTVAEWHGADARSMVEDGFLKHIKDAQGMGNYLESVGIINSDDSVQFVG